MQQLESYFQDHAASLLSHLQQATTLPELVQTTTTHFNRIIGQGSPFAGTLTQREQRLVTCFFNAVLNTLYLLGKIAIQVEQAPVQSPSEGKSGALTHTESVLAATASTLGAAVAPGPISALLAGLTSGGLAMIAFNQLSGTKFPADEVPTRLDIPLVNLSVPPEAIHACLKDAVENFDKLTETIEEIRKEALQTKPTQPPRLEEIPNVLAFFQEMLGFDQSLPDLPKPLRDYLPIIQRILRSYGIEVVQYQEGASDDTFDRQSTFGENIEAPRSLKPALVKKGQTLLKGLVMLPES